MQHSFWKMLSVIKNGFMVKKKSVVCCTKPICIRVLKILYKEGFVSGFRILPNNSKKIEIYLKYSNSRPLIINMVSLSKPGKRIYVSNNTIWKLSSAMYTLILSTSEGVLSSNQCRIKNIGGELLIVLR
uniref:Ribosomal protein S8 n=1 Tax=Vischeria stellata TaxID=1104407 RepID=A0A481XIE7_9STRA|nr:ribosomal protein S8 [Vischeria stellata]QBK36830.1 ribosomal protein S8 [Vischeria stellata]